MMLLHIGCGNRKHHGMLNLTQEQMDISKPWNYATESIDGIISMQVLQQLPWRSLIVALKESFRVLKNGGVMRFGTMLIENNDPEYILGWNNINIFSFGLMEIVLKKVGFSRVRLAHYRDSKIKEFHIVDNRSIGLGTSYIEAIK